MSPAGDSFSGAKVFPSPSINIAGNLRVNDHEITSRIPLTHLFDYNNTPQPPGFCFKKPRAGQVLFRLRLAKQAASGEASSNCGKPQTPLSKNARPKEQSPDRKGKTKWERVALPVEGGVTGWMSDAAPLGIFLQRQTSLIRLWERRLLIDAECESFQSKTVAMEATIWEDGTRSDSDTRSKISTVCSCLPLGADCPCGCTSAVRQFTRGLMHEDI
uniref:Uncharacterized protein n=1 Tax=Neospora caninum (strain Liverpool) TaxID=572307 RepID=A0A0F7UH49_NEOCL|nr:TPA: hypothetical protein BN1204_040965 [Neospora caninum Liverpool]